MFLVWEVVITIRALAIIPNHDCQRWLYWWLMFVAPNAPKSQFGVFFVKTAVQNLSGLVIRDNSLMTVCGGHHQNFGVGNRVCLEYATVLSLGLKNTSLAYFARRLYHLRLVTLSCVEPKRLDKIGAIKRCALFGCPNIYCVIYVSYKSAVFFVQNF